MDKNLVNVSAKKLVDKVLSEKTGTKFIDINDFDLQELTRFFRQKGVAFYECEYKKHLDEINCYASGKSLDEVKADFIAKVSEEIQDLASARSVKVRQMSQDEVESIIEYASKG